MRRTWAVFTFYDGHPVLVERWQSRAAALRSAEHFSFMSGRSYQVVEQLLPGHARQPRNDREQGARRLPTCATCHDVGWVCENHPKTMPRGCKCGAGMPCPVCNPSDAKHQPRLPSGMTIDVDKTDSRH
jgi:hypothetical protein